MTTALFSHAASREHVTPPGHPERVARIDAVLAALEAPHFAALLRREAPRASLDEIALAHPRAHVDRVLAAMPAEGYASFDPDTQASAGTAEAVLRACGALIGAVDAVMAGEARNAFCAVRPPGHHAEPGRAMGFCFFNQIAVAAHHLRMTHGLHRIAVVDFDVHHGNGTEAAFEADAHLFFGSTHQMPLYPGTGHADVRGIAGNIVNVPLPPGAGAEHFRVGWKQILAALERFEPEFVLISAGFDAHADDPLSHMMLTTDDFAWATQETLALARRHCGGRVVSTLEGGYDLAALAACTDAHVRALMEAA